MAGKPQNGKKALKNNIFIRFDSETDKIIRDMATQQDRPVTRVVRELVREELRRRGLMGPQTVAKRAVAANER